MSGIHAVLLAGGPAALMATATPTPLNKIASGPTITTDPATTLAQGGYGSYAYSWAVVGSAPGISIDSPFTAATTFTATGMASPESRLGAFECTVTDLAGDTVVSNIVNVTIERT